MNMLADHMPRKLRGRFRQFFVDHKSDFIFFFVGSGIFVYFFSFIFIGLAVGSLYHELGN